ncbi:hypothetical protein N0V94_002440 [Neodidymelliopsis sp. IMI 364377]|nr:hypothetical protein N0V94_002440 [Neodidymelliopsis sp. IMI 364377]
MTNQEFFSNPDLKDEDLDEYRLAALAGTAQAQSRHTESEYLAGLWSQYLWAGMLWSIPYTHEYIPTTKDAFNLEDNKKVRHKRPLAPSWSWASVTAPIVYANPVLTSLDPICEMISASTSGTAAVQTGRIEIRGHVRTGYVNPVYPFAIQEALERHRSHMMLRKPEGQKERIKFKGRAFSPDDYFLFSKIQPEMNGIWGSDFHPTFRITTGWDWRFVRGTFRPDEIISTKQEITFVAIAQQHVGRKAQSLLETNEVHDALRVYTLALVPTGKNTGEYRRVGSRTQV